MDLRTAIHRTTAITRWENSFTSALSGRTRWRDRRAAKRRFTMRYLLCARINAFPDGPMIASGVDAMHPLLWHFGPVLANSTIWSHGLIDQTPSSERIKLCCEALGIFAEKARRLMSRHIGHIIYLGFVSDISLLKTACQYDVHGVAVGVGVALGPGVGDAGHYVKTYCSGAAAGSRSSNGTPWCGDKRVGSYYHWRPGKIKRNRGISLYEDAVSIKHYAERVRVCLRCYRVACSSD